MVKNSPNRNSVESTSDIDAATPWASRAHVQGAAQGAQIDAFVEKAGEWLTIATVKNDPTFDATRVAAQIVHAVNNEETYRRLLEEMAVALEGCLSCDGLDWSAEHDGEIILDRYRALIKK